MSDSGQTSPALEASWLEWVNANLGGPSDRAEHAALAARDAMVSGGGLNEAVAAATNRWVDYGHGQKPFWEMTFWGIWLGRGAWIFALVAAFAQLFWLVPLGWIPVLALTPLPLAATIWHFYVAYRLSTYGLLAPGVLVNVTVRNSDRNDVYVGTYRWQFHGPHLITQIGTADDVLILFDPAYPKDAVVIFRSFSNSR